MAHQSIFVDETIGFDHDDYNTWVRYYRAMNAETSVEELSKAPWFLELTEYGKVDYIDGVKKLQEERNTFPQAVYEMPYRYFD